MDNLLVTHLEAICYHLERGDDNGGLGREALALFLRSLLGKFDAALAQREREASEHCEQFDAVKEARNFHEEENKRLTDMLRRIEQETVEKCALHIDVPISRTGQEFAAAIRALGKEVVR